MLLVWPSIRTATWPAASDLMGVTTVPSLPLKVGGGGPAAYPWSAARRYNRTASVQTCGTPLPFAYITPRLICATGV